MKHEEMIKKWLSVGNKMAPGELVVPLTGNASICVRAGEIERVAEDMGIDPYYGSGEFETAVFCFDFDNPDKAEEVSPDDEV